MDSHQIFRHGFNGRDLEFGYPQASSQWMTGSVKFEHIGNSPTSPLTTQFDSESLSVLGSGWEQHSSVDNLTGFCPSANSPLEITSSFHPMKTCLDGNHSLEDANCFKGANQALRELQVPLLSSNTSKDEMFAANAVLNYGNKKSDVFSPRSRVGAQLTRQGLPATLLQPFKGSNDQKYRKLSHETFFDNRHQVVPASSNQEISLCHLSKLLIECARALSENRKLDFDKLIHEAKKEVSITGEPIQRLGAYIVEGLVARNEASGPNLYRTLWSRDADSKDLLSYMQTLYDIFPYYKFGYMAANGAIAEAFKNEDRVHIIDFQIAQGTQWVTLIQALAARPNGPPQVRITGIDDPVSRHARSNGLEAVRKNLAAMSDKLKIRIEFHAVPVFAPEVTREMLDVRPGEALAVNFAMLLHHTPDESVDVNNPRDGLLRMVRSLSPKVTTLVEQESNTNTTAFVTRFMETLNFYSAMFESMDVVMPRESKDRINVEQLCLARDIVNVIACEEKERIERHELLGKWKSRLTMAGFRPYPLSPYVNSVIKGLLRYYSQYFTMTEKDGAMLLGWKNRSLISASAWH
ncbi:hypothetical protein Sjap_025359 [Stephania japonica]|uniref:Uncharacterized protein n=1 Tax=Stephania japonica TaxID=461633 RepID=A0AAP0E4P9_9MAGN